MGENEINAINPNDNYKPNNGANTFNLVIGIATLLIALLGATFAYFSATTRSKENDVTVKSAYVSISYDGGTEIIATNLIPATEKVVLNKYMKEMTPHNPEEGDIITDYDKYSSEMMDRRCVDAKGKEVCYVYQFSVQSDGVEGGKTAILPSLKVNKNQFINLSYILFKVNPEEKDGVILTDRYGFDIIPVDGYTVVSKFDNVDNNPDNIDKNLPSFATFERPEDDLQDGISVGVINPVACLYSYSKEEGVLGLRKDDSARCETMEIENNKRHTFQLLIWLEETGDVQDEQGMTFEGTVSIEVDGGDIDTGEYEDGKITGTD